MMTKKRPKKKDKHDADLFVNGISESLKTDFKVICARHDVSMRDAVVRFMEATVQNNGANLSQFDVKGET